MNVIVSREDYFNSFKKSRNYTARDIYYCYEDFRNNDYTSLKELSNRHEVNYSTVRNWKNKGVTPIITKHFDALLKEDLMPLTNDSKHLNLISELYLYCLLSGCNGFNGSTYNLELNESEENLKRVGEVLNNKLGINYVLSKRKEYNNAYRITFSSDNSLNPAIAKLISLLGCDEGARLNKEVEIPEFIKSETLAFYLYNLKGYYDKQPMQNRIYTYLWSSKSKELAEKNGLNITKKLKPLEFTFYRTRPYVVSENWICSISLPKAETNSFLKFLRNYKTKLLKNKH